VTTRGACEGGKLRTARKGHREGGSKAVAERKNKKGKAGEVAAMGLTVKD